MSQQNQGKLCHKKALRLLQKKENKKVFCKKKVRKNKGGREEGSKKNEQESGSVRKGNVSPRITEGGRD